MSSQLFEQRIALRAIIKEREKQIEKWGQQSHDDYRWLAILTEEVGELAQAILQSEFGGVHAGQTYTELIQVAAVAVQWLEHMISVGEAKSVSLDGEEVERPPYDALAKWNAYWDKVENDPDQGQEGD